MIHTAEQARADRQARRQASADALAIVETARRLARMVARERPSIDTDDLTGQIAEHALSGIAPTFTLAMDLASHQARADRARRQSETAAATGHKRQVADQDKRQVRTWRIARFLSDRQVARLVRPTPALAIAVPTDGIGRTLVTAPAAIVADAVRHESCQAGAWQGPTPRKTVRIRQSDLLAWRNLLVALGLDPAADADAATMRARSLFCQVIGAITRKPGQAGQAGAIVAALQSDGKVSKADPDAGGWHETATDQSGKKGTAGNRSRAKKVVRADADMMVAVPRFPGRDTLAGPMLSTDLAKHQIRHGADKSPVRLVREASLARMLDKHKLTAGKPVNQEPVSTIAGGWQGAEQAIRWHALATWQAPDARGARGQVVAAIRRADQASTRRTAFARLLTAIGCPASQVDQAPAPVTVGTLAAAHVTRVAEPAAGGLFPGVNLSAACRAIGLGATPGNRDALAGLIGDAARFARDQTERPYLAGDTRGTRARTLPTSGHPGFTPGHHLASPVGRLVRLADSQVGRQGAPVDLAWLATLAAAPATLAPATLSGPWRLVDLAPVNLFLVDQARQAGQAGATLAGPVGAYPWQAATPRRQVTRLA